MKNILLSLLCILSLQSMMMQAAAESKDDYQDKRQAIIDEAMQPENYINLKSGFAFLQSQGLNVPSFHDVLEQNIPQSDDEALDLHAITAQTEDILTSNMKNPFLTKLKIAMEEKKTLNQINDPIFKYVMKHKDSTMQGMVRLWLYEWSTTRNEKGWTPLHWTARNNNVEIIRMLLAAGADVNIQNNKGWTPLHLTISLGSLEAQYTLIAAGAHINIQDNVGWTPLHRSVWCFNPAEEIKNLFALGADLNIQDNNGWTPLHIATKNNRINVVRMLIDAGANVNIQSKSGQIAEQLICTDEMEAVFRQIQNNNKVQAMCCTIS